MTASPIRVWGVYLTGNQSQDGRVMIEPIKSQKKGM